MAISPSDIKYFASEFRNSNSYTHYYIQYNAVWKEPNLKDNSWSLNPSVEKIFNKKGDETRDEGTYVLHYHPSPSSTREWLSNLKGNNPEIVKEFNARIEAIEKCITKQNSEILSNKKYASSYDGRGADYSFEHRVLENEIEQDKKMLKLLDKVFIQYALQQNPPKPQNSWYCEIL